MTTTRAVVVRNQGNLDDMFGDLMPPSALEIKKMEVATHLAALMSYKGKTRAGLATEMGWNKSRITRVLSGKENLTIKTIWEFSSYLGVDFSVAFRESTQPKPKQPWQVQRAASSALSSDQLRTLVVPLDIQTAEEVALDLISGNEKQFYISFDTSALSGTSQTLISNMPMLTHMKSINPTPTRLQFVATAESE